MCLSERHTLSRALSARWTSNDAHDTYNIRKLRVSLAQLLTAWQRMMGRVPLTGHHADVQGSVSSPFVGMSAAACGVNLPPAAVTAVHAVVESVGVKS